MSARKIAERLISEHTLLIIVDTHKASFVEAPEIYEKSAVGYRH